MALVRDARKTPQVRNSQKLRAFCQKGLDFRLEESVCVLAGERRILRRRTSSPGGCAASGLASVRGRDELCLGEAKGSAMLNEMSEARRLMLQAAAAREDRLLQPPANARGAAEKNIAGSLVDAGWAKEI